jgi:O-6-methylguanine DNA methyltransferase
LRLYYDVFPTEMGWFSALGSEAGLRYASLRPSPQEAVESLGSLMDGAEEDSGALMVVREIVQAFVLGESYRLEEISLDLEGSPLFHRAAWEACRSIPLGETRSYAWLAANAGRPGAYRAAGQAMARNRLSLVVPCHRVIGSDGGLHGYGGGGLAVKARLLRLEAGLRDRTPTAP